MSSLTIEKPGERAPIITICADSGLGKTTLASLFPNPIFIRAEDGLQAIPKEYRPDAFPLITKEAMLWEQLSHLVKADHHYETVVIDSVTALDRMFTQWVVEGDKNKPRSINQALGGYGAGLSAVAGQHQRVRKAVGMINDRGITVVFIAHADMETISPPDSEEYTRWCLRLHKKSVAPYVDDSDLVGFIKLESFLKGEEGERKKAISSGDRVLVAYATAANISKNRYGITDNIDLPQNQNPLMNLIPYFIETYPPVTDETQNDQNNDQFQEQDV